MKTQELFLSFKNYEMYIGESKIDVTKHFFMFFLQLAIAFKQNESWYSQGWCEMEDFLHLPSWENTSLRDAGKNTVRDLKKIEAQIALRLNNESTPLVIKQDKAYVFRLNDKIIEDIKFDIQIEKIIELLFSDDFTNLNKEQSADAQQVHSRMYIDGIINTANIIFEMGNPDLAEQNLLELLDESKSAVQVSLNDKLSIYTSLAYYAYTHHQEQKTKTYLCKAEKVLELTKDFFKVSAKYHARYWLLLGAYELRFQSNLKAFQHFDTACLYLTRSDTHFYEWGFYHRGYALIAERNNDFQTAHKQHWKTLNYWMKAKWWFGVQAAYYNLGSLNLKAFEGMFIKESNVSVETKNSYLNNARKWLTWCLRFSGSSGTAQDTAWVTLKLACVSRYENQIEDALEYLEISKNIIDTTGSKVELVEYHLQYSKLDLVQGGIVAAKAHTESALKLIDYPDALYEKKLLEEQLKIINRKLS